MQDFSKKFRPIFVSQLHGDEINVGYFQHDGATAHSTRTTIAMLHKFFENQIISRNTENIWPRKPCYLTPADFFIALFKEHYLSNTC